MIAELKLSPQDWTTVIPSISSALGEASHSHLGLREDGIARCPLEVMTGITPNHPINRNLTSKLRITDEKTMDRARLSQIISITELQTALDHVHKEVEGSVNLSSTRAIAAHNKATNIVNQSFSIGDFVLGHRAKDRGQKL